VETILLTTLFFFNNQYNFFLHIYMKLILKKNTQQSHTSNCYILLSLISVKVFFACNMEQMSTSLVYLSKDFWVKCQIPPAISKFVKYPMQFGNRQISIWNCKTSVKYPPLLSPFVLMTWALTEYVATVLIGVLCVLILFFCVLFTACLCLSEEVKGW
jgi:hypothetical protein